MEVGPSCWLNGDFFLLGIMNERKKDDDGKEEQDVDGHEDGGEGSMGDDDGDDCLSSPESNFDDASVQLPVPFGQGQGDATSLQLEDILRADDFIEKDERLTTPSMLKLAKVFADLHLPFRFFVETDGELQVGRYSGKEMKKIFLSFLGDWGFCRKEWRIYFVFRFGQFSGKEQTPQEICFSVLISM